MDLMGKIRRQENIRRFTELKQMKPFLYDGRKKQLSKSYLKSIPVLTPHTVLMIIIFSSFLHLITKGFLADDFLSVRIKLC